MSYSPVRRSRLAGLASFLVAMGIALLLIGVVQTIVNVLVTLASLMLMDALAYPFTQGENVLVFFGGLVCLAGGALITSSVSSGRQTQNDDQFDENIDGDPEHCWPTPGDHWQDGDVIVHASYRNPFQAGCFGVVEIRFGRLLLWEPSVEGCVVRREVLFSSPSAFRRATPEERNLILIWMADLPIASMDCEILPLDQRFYDQTIKPMLAEHEAFLVDADREEREIDEIFTEA